MGAMSQSTEAVSQSDVSDCRSALSEKLESRKPWTATAAVSPGACPTRKACSTTKAPRKASA